MKKIILLTLFVFILSAQVNADDKYGVFQINNDYCGVSKEEIIAIQYKDVDNNRESSSGSCYSEWICTEWEPCNSRGYQTRQCIDKWSCPVIIKLPELYRECDVETSSLIQTEENANSNEEEIIIEPETRKEYKEFFKLNEFFDYGKVSITMNGSSNTNNTALGVHFWLVRT